jgi:3-hydroxyisobutyrate dehydrogenase-like beta-hydroxyacid dehydrogenase
LRKDMRAMPDEAETLGVELPVTALTPIRSAAETGRGRRDSPPRYRSRAF